MHVAVGTGCIFDLNIVILRRNLRSDYISLDAACLKHKLCGILNMVELDSSVSRYLIAQNSVDLAVCHSLKIKQISCVIGPGRACLKLTVLKMRYISGKPLARDAWLRYLYIDIYIVNYRLEPKHLIVCRVVHVVVARHHKFLTYRIHPVHKIYIYRDYRDIIINLGDFLLNSLCAVIYGIRGYSLGILYKCDEVLRIIDCLIGLGIAVSDSYLIALKLSEGIGCAVNVICLYGKYYIGVLCNRIDIQVAYVCVIWILCSALYLNLIRHGSCLAVGGFIAYCIRILN